MNHWGEGIYSNKWLNPAIYEVSPNTIFKTEIEVLRNIV
jgi:hypothetical protein